MNQTQKDNKMSKSLLIIVMIFLVLAIAIVFMTRNNIAMANQYCDLFVEIADEDYLQKSLLQKPEGFNLLTVDDLFEIAHVGYRFKEKNYELAESEVDFFIRNKMIYVANKHANSLIVPLFSDRIPNDLVREMMWRHPIEFSVVGHWGRIAEDFTHRFYGENTWGNNSDAFRHGYWSASLAIVMGVERAEVWTTAWENDSSGLDKEMDLKNNAIGKTHGLRHSHLTYRPLAYLIRDYVSRGDFWRFHPNFLPRPHNWNYYFLIPTGTETLNPLDIFYTADNHSTIIGLRIPTSENTRINIPYRINGHLVTRIGNGTNPAFNIFNGKLTIPSSVTYIARHAFVRTAATIRLLGSMPPRLGVNAFHLTRMDDNYFYIPTGATQNFRNNGWDFNKLLEPQMIRFGWVGSFLTGHNFASMTHGQTPPNGFRVNVMNMGQNETGIVTITGYSPHFTVNTNSLPNLVRYWQADRSIYFIVRPREGLPVGTHTVNIRVVAESGFVTHFAVSVTVTSPASLWYFVGEFFPAGGTYEWFDMPFHSYTAKFVFQLACLTVYEILQEWDMLFFSMMCDCGRSAQYWIHFLGHAFMGGSGSWGRNLEDYDMPIDYGGFSSCVNCIFSSHHFWTLSFRLYLRK